MAETVVFSLLQKLGDVMTQEAVFLHGVKDQVEVMKHELIRIQCFLKDADSKRKGNNSVKNWVKEVRDVSFRIEDVIDTFLLEVQQIPHKEPSSNMITKLRRLFTEPGKMSEKEVLMHKLGNEINKIQARLLEISTSREAYGIQNLVENSTAPVNRLRRKLVVPNIDNDIIGFEDENKKITGFLLDQNVLKRRVVSIVGQGGIGKTTIAQKIYNSADVKNNFNICIWLTISQEFEPIQLLKDVLRELGETTKSQMDRDEAYFIGEIHKSLSNKKYLAVLDDIWNDSVWSDILHLAFPDVKNGSRVLITTRFLNVAKMADPKGVHELRFLNNEESLELILEKAFPRENGSECYPPDLSEIAKEFVKNCGGLPLALVVVGGLLSTKPPNYGAWRKVLETMDWQIEGDKCVSIIATSYEDLPLPLKSCFIYLASFPEDYEIRADSLIRLWIAEGFITDVARQTMEDIAEKYLEELAQRCMIQVLERSVVDGSIKNLRVHDLLLDLAIHEAEEKNFLKVFSNPNDLLSINYARRATFQLEDSSWKKTSFDEKQLTGHIKPNIRTLFFFGKVIPLDSEFKLLRVLFVKNHNFHENDKPLWQNSLKGMLQLRWLVFENCTFHDFILPLDHLHNLQTLEIIGDYDGIIVPVSLWGIKTLRHVNGVSIEIGSAPRDLPNLQTLIGVVEVDEPGIEVLNMPNLRHLQLHYTCDAWESTKVLLLNLDSLVFLDLISDIIESNCDIPLEIINTSKFPSHKRLQYLSLQGAWRLGEVALNVGMFPPHIIELTIMGSHINQDLMPVLEKLPSLKVLVMRRTYRGKKMVCSKGGFCQLQTLNIMGLEELQEWKIELGAMPVLDRLLIGYCEELQIVPDLHHVPSLNVLELTNMNEEFNSRAQNEDHHKIEHIPKLTIL